MSTAVADSVLSPSADPQADYLALIVALTEGAEVPRAEAATITLAAGKTSADQERHRATLQQRREAADALQRAAAIEADIGKARADRDKVCDESEKAIAKATAAIATAKGRMADAESAVSALERERQSLCQSAAILAKQQDRDGVLRRLSAQLTALESQRQRLQGEIQNLAGTRSEAEIQQEISKLAREIKGINPDDPGHAKRRQRLAAERTRLERTIAAIGERREQMSALAGEIAAALAAVEARKAWHNDWRNLIIS